MPAALTDIEKVRVRHHLGYPNVTDVQTFVLGVPAAVETQFALERAMNNIRDEALPEVRRLIQVLDQIEEQEIQNLELLQVQRLGDLTLNTTGDDREQKQLIVIYNKWASSLADALGSVRNPNDKRLGAMGTGGINIPVQH